MSRIGKKAVVVPAGVKVSINDRTVNIEGPKGKLSMSHRPEVKVVWADSEKAIRCTVAEGVELPEEVSKYWGTTRALIANMIEGVTKGYEKNLEVVGVGWQAVVQGKKLKLQVGFGNAIMMDIPPGLVVTVEKQFVKVVGPDKQLVGQFASAMRSKRKPEPYNGKGIKYVEEIIKRKQGKQFGA